MKSSTEVKIFRNIKMAAEAVALEIHKLIKRSKEPIFNIALSGGNTPRILYTILAEEYRDIINWRNIHFWWGDERSVHPESDESNYRMANEALLSKVDLPSENIHRIKGEDNPLEESIRYSEEIVDNITVNNGLPVFDLILLGMGADGHTASIFPDSLSVINADEHCVAVKHPQTGQVRITLSGRVINSAKNVFFMVTGEDKADRISEIMSNDKSAHLYPAFHIDPVNGNLTWFLDEAAASKMR